MTTYVGKLTAVYREQLALYNGVLTLAQEERTALLQFRPLGEIVRSFEAKRNILRTIDRMEAEFAAEKAHYRRNKSLLDAGLTHELNDTIKSVKNTIQRIMEIERLNEETIMLYGQKTPDCERTDTTAGGLNDAGQGYAG